MNTKKLLSAVTALAIAGSLLSACGNNDSSAPSSAPQSSAADSTADSSSDSLPEESSAPDSSEPDTEEGYQLLWSDEFDGDSLNEDIWTREIRDPGWTNNELQAYTDSDDNIFIRDGKLVLKAIKVESGNATGYTSGKVNSQNKADFTYGKVVVSAKVPEGQGLWPAIWMMPQDEGKYGQWPKCGEIDIMEVLGSATNIAYGTLHYGEPHGEQQGKVVLESGTFADDFHEYSVEWEPGEIRWYIDGELYHSANDWFSAVEGEQDKPYPAPFDQPFFVQMNLAVGGNWPGDPDETTDFDKAEFEIDYVRVYQKSEYDTDVKKPEKLYRDPDETGNYIINGDFSQAEDLSDDKQWTFYLAEGGAGAAEIKDNTLIVSSTDAGSQEYSVQMFQPGLPMIKGKKYRVSFDAKADEARNIVVCVSAPTAGWGRYLPDTTQAITTEMKTYTFEFEMTEKDDNNGRLEFNLGKYGETATVYIQNVRVEEIS